MSDTDTVDWKLKCEELAEQVAHLKLERQNLIEQVARERLRADALFVAYPPQAKNEPPPDQRKHRSATAANTQVAVPVISLSEPPLRYQVADAVNQVFKKVMPSAHKLVRSSTSTQEK